MKTDIKFYITEALFKVLITKNIKDITITEIVKLSNISRTTFYNNFKNINDVICYKFNLIFEDFYKIYNLNKLRKETYKSLLKNILIYINNNKNTFNIIKNKLFFNFKNSLDKYFINIINNKYNYYVISGIIINLSLIYIENEYNINDYLNNIKID